MIKLLYKPTGNIFTLPDEEAIRIKKDDRGNDYVFLEAGLQEKECKTISKEETKQIVASVKAQIEQNEIAEQEADAKKEAKEAKKKKVDSFRVDDTEELKKMSKSDLVLLAEKLGIRDMQNCKVNEIIEYIQGSKKKTLKKPRSGRTRKV